jgi:hypothetical protein
MSKKQKLVDPVEIAKEEGMLFEPEETQVSIESLDLDDLKPISDTQSKKNNPFSGYKDKIRVVDGVEVNATHIVAYHPRIDIFQDPSGLNQSVTVIQRDKNGRPIRDEYTGRPKVIEKKVTYKTYHNRLIRDQVTSENIDVVFDRELILDSGKKIERFAFVPSPWVRAQIVYSYDKRTDTIRKDDKYLLLDIDQASRLRECFELIIKPNRLSEIRAASIMGG